MFQGAGHVLQGAARDQAFFSQKNPKLVRTFWEWGALLSNGLLSQCLGHLLLT